MSVIRGLEYLKEIEQHLRYSFDSKISSMFSLMFHATFLAMVYSDNNAEAEVKQMLEIKFRQMAKRLGLEENIIQRFLAEKDLELLFDDFQIQFPQI
ncbi:MAG: hypothetical protein DRR19_22305 [Candidatus Parabeggiatoa sp. nov. 1]|nr:MAG: hypothetical protein DRR19_22305 [Gammaproteobacteria bacterium]